MSDDAPPPDRFSTEARIDQVAADAVEKADRAATRRRWISLAEFVAVAGLIVAVAGLWVSWSDHRTAEADRQAERSEATKARALVTLSGDVSHSGDTVALKDAAHQLREVQVIFPSALGIAAQSGLFHPKIDANWFDDKLLALTKDGPDHREGRLPVILAATYWDGDVERTDRAIYDVAWEIEGRFLRGRKLRIRALTLHARSGTQAALDAAWARQKP